MKLPPTLVLLAMIVTGYGRAVTSPTPGDVGQLTGESLPLTETAAPATPVPPAPQGRGYVQSF